MDIKKLFRRAKKPVKTYEIKVSTMGMYKTIKCLKCNRTSYNHNDIEHKYCGYCHEYHQ